MTLRSRRLRALAGAALLAAATGASAAATDPFTAHFDVSRGSLALGTMTFSLRSDDKPDCYVYRGRADPNALVQMFIGDITETSRFCVVDDRIRPRFFRHHIDGKKDDSYTLRFDWDRHRVRYQSESGQTKTLKIADQALDPLTLQIAARRWLGQASDPAALGTRAFTLVDEDELEPYPLRVEPAGSVRVPGGRFSVLLVKRVGHDKHLRFWLAKNADWIPVRVEHQEDDGAIFQMNMTRLTR